MTEVEITKADAVTSIRQVEAMTVARRSVAEVAQQYHNSPAFTADMSAAFKKAAEQAQTENAQLDEA